MLNGRVNHGCTQEMFTYGRQVAGVHFLFAHVFLILIKNNLSRVVPHGFVIAPGSSDSNRGLSMTRTIVKGLKNNHGE